jgi:hypothetical protein
MFKLLKINIILAQSLCRVPKMCEEVSLEEFFEYYGGKGFFVKKKNHFYHFF